MAKGKNKVYLIFTLWYSFLFRPPFAITKAESRTLTDRRRAPHHAKGRLCRMRVGAPAALA